MTYAVIRLQGKQYRVEVGQTLTIDRIHEDAKKTLKITDVLLVVDGDKVKIGTPLVDGATVSLEVVSHDRGEKIRVSTFKAKSRYRRTIGHRQEETTLRVDSISAK